MSTTFLTKAKFATWVQGSDEEPRVPDQISCVKNFLSYK